MGVQPSVAAHHNCEEMQSFPLRRRDQAVAGSTGITRFDTGRTGVEVAVTAVYRLAADQCIGVVVLALLVDIGGGDGNISDVADDHEVVMGDGLLRNEEHLIGCSLVVVGEAVGIVKVCDLAAKFFCAVVHHGDKVVDASTDQRCEHVAGVAGRLNHGAIQKITERKLFAGNDLRTAALFVQTGTAVLSCCDGFIQAVFPPFHGFHCQQYRHDLCQTCWCYNCVLVLLVDYSAGVQIGKDNIFPVELRCRRRMSGRSLH